MESSFVTYPHDPFVSWLAQNQPEALKPGLPGEDAENNHEIKEAHLIEFCDKEESVLLWLHKHHKEELTKIKEVRAEPQRDPEGKYFIAHTYQNKYELKNGLIFETTCLKGWILWEIFLDDGRILRVKNVFSSQVECKYPDEEKFNRFLLWLKVNIQYVRKSLLPNDPDFSKLSYLFEEKNISFQIERGVQVKCTIGLNEIETVNIKLTDAFDLPTPVKKIDTLWQIHLQSQCILDEVWYDSKRLLMLDGNNYTELNKNNVKMRWLERVFPEKLQETLEREQISFTSYVYHLKKALLNWQVECKKFSKCEKIPEEIKINSLTLCIIQVQCLQEQCQVIYNILQYQPNSGNAIMEAKELEISFGSLIHEVMLTISNIRAPKVSPEVTAKKEEEGCILL